MARKKTKSPKKSPRAKPRAIFRLKITLQGTKPPIWRRLEVADCSLSELHDLIQSAMGWDNAHLWMFIIGGETYGEPRMDDFAAEFEDQDAAEFSLSQFAEAGVKKFDYEYDMGDGWRHKIAIEKVVEPDPDAEYPRCVAGAGACPPEDCGGIPGYYRLLEILADPKHPEHDEMMDWVGGEFDPGEFDLEHVNAKLAAYR